MQLLESELCAVMRNVWSALVGLEIERTERAPAMERGARPVIGRVDLCGGWTGALVLRCGATLAAEAAAAMFGCDPEQAGATERRDAMAAIVGVAAGNVRSLLPEPATPSAPMVFDGSGPGAGLDGGHVVTRIAFAWRGDGIEVALVRRSG